MEGISHTGPRFLILPGVRCELLVIAEDSLQELLLLLRHGRLLGQKVLDELRRHGIECRARLLAALPFRFEGCDFLLAFPIDRDHGAG